MRPSALLFLPLLQTALALPFGDFQISSLRACYGCRENGTGIAFIFHDTNTDASAECSATFRSTNDTAFPSRRYRACGNDTNFGFKFGAYDGIEKFQLDLLRRYEDPSVGDPPMNIVSLFASVNVTEGSDYRCSNSTRQYRGQSCNTPQGSFITIPITAAAAKK